MPRPASALMELTRARLLEFLRDPAAVFWVFGFPILLAVVLGIAFRSRPAPTYPVAVVDGHPGSAALATDLATSKALKVRRLAPAAADAALRRGQVAVVAVPWPRGEVTWRLDPTREDGPVARRVADDALQRARGRKDAVQTRTEPVSEAGGRYIDFLVPGLVGLNLMGSSMWGVGFAVVDTRKRRLLKRFAATPMRRSDFLLGFMLSRMAFLAAEVAVLIAFGWWAFGVAVHGSIWALSLVSLLGALTFAGMAVLIGARTDSTEVASGWANFVMMPMWMFSGAFFSYERFPEFLWPALRALPLTALNDALRAIMNDGTAVWHLWPQILVLAVWGVLSFAVALKIFRWQ